MLPEGSATSLRAVCARTARATTPWPTVMHVTNTAACARQRPACIQLLHAAADAAAAPGCLGHRALAAPCALQGAAQLRQIAWHVPSRAGTGIGGHASAAHGVTTHRLLGPSWSARLLRSVRAVLASFSEEFAPQPGPALQPTPRSVPGNMRTRHHAQPLCCAPFSQLALRAQTHRRLSASLLTQWPPP